MKVSLICTLLNEGPSARKLLDSLARQTRVPDEIIFVDGGSTDNTIDILKAYDRLSLQIIQAPGANISRGRNIAIEAAAGPVIASTDAGVRLDDRWLENLLQPFQTRSNPVAAAGFFVPDPQSAFELAMGATVLPLVSEIKADSFLPSSRSVAFLKSSWSASGRYPEWLDYCEDLIFDFRMRDQVGPFTFVPDAVVYFRPRSTLTAFFKQYYRYARGDGKADLWRKRHAIRYLTYLVALPLLIGLGLAVSPWWWLFGGVLGSWGLFYVPYRRLFRSWSGYSAYEKVQAILWVPIIRISGDLAKMIGYPVGWRWRLQRLASRPELRWQQKISEQR